MGCAVARRRIVCVVGAADDKCARCGSSAGEPVGDRAEIGDTRLIHQWIAEPPPVNREAQRLEVEPLIRCCLALPLRRATSAPFMLVTRFPGVPLVAECVSGCWSSPSD